MRSIGLGLGPRGFTYDLGLFCMFLISFPSKLIDKREAKHNVFVYCPSLAYLGGTARVSELAERIAEVNITKQSFSVVSTANRGIHGLLKRCGAVLVGLSMQMFSCNLQ